ncbi:ATP-grasp domain-containing protein [Desulforhopalus sp. 52FAK]
MERTRPLFLSWAVQLISLSPLTTGSIMTDTPRITVTSNDQFRKVFHLLDQTSIVCCRLKLYAGEEHILVDLLERNVRLIPSATAQLASRSKAHQTRIFAPFMIPHTRVIYDTNNLLKATTSYQQKDIKKVVVKQNRKNGGMGIHLFQSVEDVYNHAAFGNLCFPFVLQPYVADFTDIRVIIIGDYAEAYQRINPWNFRHNLHCGGQSCPITMDDKLLSFCRKIMDRSEFPYAHMDIMETPDKKLYLTEINLRGGLLGAQISPDEYKDKIAVRQQQLLGRIQAT